LVLDPFCGCGIAGNLKKREKGIFGNKSLLLIIRAPKNSKVKGRFLIGAQVASRSSKWRIVMKE
jgi:hypothetical protein